MYLRTLIAIYSVVIVISSMAFDTVRNPEILALLGLLFVLLHYVKKDSFYIQVLQFALLAGMHLLSGSNMVLILYLLHLGKQFQTIRSKRWAFAFSVVYFIVFAIVSAYHNPLYYTHLYKSLFYTLFSGVSFSIASIYVYKFVQILRSHAQILLHEKERLSAYDTLTGLINFDECHRKLEKLVEKQEPIVLILLDCKDLKSLNSANGFHGVNKLLKQVAQLLGIMFPDALFTARYGGDEFAIVLRANQVDAQLSYISHQLASEFTKLTGIQITYGTSIYPNDAQSKDDLITIAEKNMFVMKREAWLKQEEQMFRSEKLRVVGELASGMAHEIRNPLTTIKGFLQIAKANGYNIEQWYGLIMNEIDRMSMLTGEFLQFSKPQPKQFKLGNLQGCVQRVVSLIESEATRLGHSVKTEMPDDEVLLWMDQDKMIQLLLNMAKNSFDAMPLPGEVTFRLTTKSKHTVIEIRDTGIGMTSEELEQIFTPFYTTKENGTGLGLSICHKIIQDHQGNLEVQSEKNKGTLFTITLPLADMN
ncbi:ATP-binding protein [Paenibacillus thalictri]|uniref:histidine kinase n=1 Tax=Paenibacillus thalictri TaxID=2527873 RepID=A0A4Q9DRH0_9BACL|nr:ATP-binding protein [Paenibacillus thalictri]TBL78231.1 diguanylate cyclase [Paenibacillus thalictri]